MTSAASSAPTSAIRQKRVLKPVAKPLARARHGAANRTERQSKPFRDRSLIDVFLVHQLAQLAVPWREGCEDIMDELGIECSRGCACQRRRTTGHPCGLALRFPSYEPFALPNQVQQPTGCHGVQPSPRPGWSDRLLAQLHEGVRDRIIGQLHMLRKPTGERDRECIRMFSEEAVERVVVERHFDGGDEVVSPALCVGRGRHAKISSLAPPDSRRWAMCGTPR